MSTEEPWLLMKEVYRDVTFVVAGSRLSYHKAVLSQHSRLIRSLLQDDGWCKCYDVVISLDDVGLNDVKAVMELIYNGTGGISSQNHGDIKAVISMLQIDTIVVDDLEAEEGVVLEALNTSGIGVVEEEDVLVTKSLSEDGVKESVMPSKIVQEEPEVIEKTVKRRGRKRKQDLDVVTTPKTEEIKTSVTNKESKKPSNPSFIEPSSMKTLPKVLSNTSTENPQVQDVFLTPTVKKSKTGSVDVCEITIDIDDDDKLSEAPAESEKFLCPYKDCQSDSKNAQSIKVHLALVHYKKIIQAEFPNWKKQKCESCDKIFGQMTAYYLHMANHQKYKYMDLSPEEFKASNRQNIINSAGPPTKVEKTSLLRPETPPAKPTSSTLTPLSALVKPSYSPAVVKPLSRSHSFVQGVTKSTGSTIVSKRPEMTASFSQSKTKFQQVRTTPASKLAAKIVSKASITPRMKAPGPSTAPPGPPSFTFVDTGLRTYPPATRKSKTSLKQQGQPSKDVKKQRGF